MTRCIDKYPKDEFPVVYNQLVDADDDGKVTSTDWYCIDAEDFSILGDPWSQSMGYTANIAVDYCKNMGSRPQLHTDLSNCVTDTDVLQEKLPYLQAQTMVINKFFSPQAYDDNEK